MKQMIEKELLSMFANMGMDKPENFDAILAYVVEDVTETSAGDFFSYGDVVSAFRRYVEGRGDTEGLYLFYTDKEDAGLSAKIHKALQTDDRSLFFAWLEDANLYTLVVKDAPPEYLLDTCVEYGNYMTITKEEGDKIIRWKKEIFSED